MKILFWTEVFWPHIGGGEIFCLDLYKSLRDRGHDLVLITDQNLANLDEKAVVEGLPVYRLPFREGLAGNIRKLAYAKKRVEEIKQEFSPDLIHLHTFGPTSTFFIESQKREHIPAMLTLHVHPSIFLKPGSEFLSYLTRSIDGVCSVSQHVFAESINYFSDPSLRKYCIMNAVPEPRHFPEPSLATKEPFLLSLGRIIPEKGFSTALEAFSQLTAEFPELRFVIAGEGPELSKLQKIARGLGVASRVEFPGWVAPQEVYPLMAKSQLVLIPSTWEEPFGLVALEAAHMGKSVVATRSGGLPEIVIDGETGRLVEKGDPEGMAQALGDLLRNPEQATTMGLSAQKRAREVFPFEAMVDQYEAAYAQILAEGGRESP